ncbi:MAG: ATP-binding cassette domain-containing protein [Coriobacteriales bacterium]
MALLAFDNVSFSYPGSSTPALSGVSLQLQAGEYLAVLGANGSGKSTLALHMNGLLRPSEGSVTLQLPGGELLDSRRREQLPQLRRACSMVFQDPDEQTVAATVEEDVAFGPENLGLPREELRRRVGRALERVDLAGREEQLVASLSRGQRQRVAVAGALAMEPAVLVCDEPTAMLDAQGSRAVMEVLAEVNRAGCAVVLITHSMEAALQAQRIIVMEEGRIALDGAPREVFTAQHARELRDAGLELPPAAAYALDCGWGDPLPLTIGELAERLGSIS